MIPEALPLAGLDFALVGPGRVGASLAHWAVARGARCTTIAGRCGSSRAVELAAELGAEVADADERADPRADLLWICVPDHEIGDLARRMARHPRRGVALHVAGALSASELAPLSKAGCRIGTFHPLRAFPAVEPDLCRAAGTFFALDGDAEARALGRRLAQAFGGESAVVAEEQRPLYHWAATLAAGGVVTLLATARSVGRGLGLPESALSGYGRLAEGALAAALEASEPAATMTGPVARGDQETIDRHLRALASSAPDLLPLAVELARATLAVVPPDPELEPARRALADRLARRDLLDRPKDRVLASQTRHPA